MFHENYELYVIYISNFSIHFLGNSINNFK